jgi:hypothetical protein
VAIQPTRATAEISKKLLQSFDLQQIKKIIPIMDNEWDSVGQQHLNHFFYQND